VEVVPDSISPEELKGVTVEPETGKGDTQRPDAGAGRPQEQGPDAAPERSPAASTLAGEGKPGVGNAEQSTGAPGKGATVRMEPRGQGPKGPALEQSPAAQTLPPEAGSFPERGAASQSEEHAGRELSPTEHEAVLREMNELKAAKQDSYEVDRFGGRESTPRYAELQQKIADHIDTVIERNQAERAAANPPAGDVKPDDPGTHDVGAREPRANMPAQNPMASTGQGAEAAPPAGTEAAGSSSPEVPRPGQLSEAEHAATIEEMIEMERSGTAFDGNGNAHPRYQELHDKLERDAAAKTEGWSKAPNPSAAVRPTETRSGGGDTVRMSPNGPNGRDRPSLMDHEKKG
jgi:hypothetical protein